MAMPSFDTVDAYLAAQPEPARTTLTMVRACIREAVPRAVEGMAYKMPGYTLEGAPLLYFAGWKRHFSLYPATPSVVQALEEELAPYVVERGTIRFPLDRPAPLELIGRIARLRAASLGEAAAERSRAASLARSKPRRADGAIAEVRASARAKAQVRGARVARAGAEVKAGAARAKAGAARAKAGAAKAGAPAKATTAAKPRAKAKAAKPAKPRAKAKAAKPAKPRAKAKAAKSAKPRAPA